MPQQVKLIDTTRTGVTKQPPTPPKLTWRQRLVQIRLKLSSDFLALYNPLAAVIEKSLVRLTVTTLTEIRAWLPLVRRLIVRTTYFVWFGVGVYLLKNYFPEVPTVYHIGAVLIFIWLNKGE